MKDRKESLSKFFLWNGTCVIRTTLKQKKKGRLEFSDSTKALTKPLCIESEIELLYKMKDDNWELTRKLKNNNNNNNK